MSPPPCPPPIEGEEISLISSPVLTSLPPPRRTGMPGAAHVREVSTHGRSGGKFACSCRWHVSKYGFQPAPPTGAHEMFEIFEKFEIFVEIPEDSWRFQDITGFEMFEIFEMF